MTLRQALNGHGTQSAYWNRYHGLKRLLRRLRVVWWPDDDARRTALQHALDTSDGDGHRVLCELAWQGWQLRRYTRPETWLLKAWDRYRNPTVFGRRPMLSRHALAHLFGSMPPRWRPSDGRFTQDSCVPPPTGKQDSCVTTPETDDLMRNARDLAGVLGSWRDSWGPMGTEWRRLGLR